MKTYIFGIIAILLTSCTPQPSTNVEEIDVIVISPLPNQEVTSPLTVTGQARGYWFFEASFPIQLTDENGVVIANAIATAKDNWMTKEFVQFEAALQFKVPKTGTVGNIVLEKANPSGLPENDDVLIIPVTLK